MTWSSHTRSWQISRRHVLRGLGASLALPLLDAMESPRVLAATAEGIMEAAPKRLAFFYVPNGVNLSHWTPQREGYGYDLPSILQPLATVRDRVSILSGLAHDKGRANGDGAGDHARAASTFLTGCQPRKTEAGNIHVGMSVDQVAARHMGQATRFASLELGCDRTRDSGNCDSGYSCAYSHNIAWSSPNTPVAKEIDPRQVFERLFGQTALESDAKTAQERQLRRRSVLDFVASDARSLQTRIGRNDRRKLSEYMEAVRQIERRLERTQVALANDTHGAAPPAGIPQEFATHVRLILDMLVLAFQTDQTRVSTCMFAQDGSNRSYGEIEVPEGHHDLSHHGGDAEKLEKIRRINHFHMTHFAYFLERLQATPEGDSNLLDQSLIVYGSGLGDGNRHNHDNLPVLLAGQGGGAIRSGRHIRFRAETPMCNLFLSLLDTVGAQVPRFGDSTGRLPQLS